MWHKIRNYFLTGLVVAAPVAITIYLAWLFIETIDKNITPLIPVKYNPETYLPVSIPGLGVLVVFIVLTLLGAFTANFFGKRLLSLGERVMGSMPVVRTIYSTLKQIFETVASQSSSSFRDVVLVEYPRKGLWAIAFVTSEAKGPMQDVVEETVVNVFLPTTPNPTSGFLLFVPKSDLLYLDMSVEEGIKYVISAGLVIPEDAIKRNNKNKASLTSDT